MRCFVGLSFAVSCLALACPAQAADAPVGAGQLAFNAGVGLGKAPLPLYVGLDVGVHRDVTLGGDVFLFTRKGDIAVMGRGDYHFNRLLGIPREGDFYLGAGLFFSGSGLYPRLQLGGRWFFSPAFGLNLELGGATNAASGLFGFTMRLGS